MLIMHTMLLLLLARSGLAWPGWCLKAKHDNGQTWMEKQTSKSELKSENSELKEWKLPILNWNFVENFYICIHMMKMRPFIAIKPHSSEWNSDSVCVRARVRLAISRTGWMLCACWNGNVEMFVALFGAEGYLLAELAAAIHDSRRECK